MNENISKINDIERRALEKFHNDHSDGDLAIHDVVREMSELFGYRNLEEIDGDDFAVPESVGGD